MLSSLRKSVSAAWADRRAVTAIEYAMIAALIAIIIIAAVTTLGGNVGQTFNSVSSEL